MDLPIRYETLPEPPNLGIQPGRSAGKPFWTVEIDGRDIEVISLRLDETAQLSLMPAWLYLRAGPALTLLLHTCGDGSGWREVDEGLQQFSIRSDRFSRGYMIFACLHCASEHRMRADGTIEWTGLDVDD